MFVDTSLDRNELIGSAENAARASDIVIDFDDVELEAPLVGPGTEDPEINDGTSCVP